MLADRNAIKQKVPNAVTVGRMILVPIFIVLMMLRTFEAQVAALVVFVIAAISDLVDGKLARRFEAKSRLGTFLDPFADKLLVLGAFFLMPILLPGVVPWWAIILIAIRDVLVTGLRVYAEMTGSTVKTLPLAKTKTTFQLTYVILLLVLMAASKLPWFPAIAEWAEWLIHSPIMFVFLLVVVALTVITGLFYFVRQEKE